MKDAIKVITQRAASVTQSTAQGQRVEKLLKARIDYWLKKAAPKPGGARLGYQGQRDGTTVALLGKRAPESGKTSPASVRYVTLSRVSG